MPAPGEGNQNVKSSVRGNGFAENGVLDTPNGSSPCLPGHALDVLVANAWIDSRHDWLE
jgi:hypothetical protein